MSVQEHLRVKRSRTIEITGPIEAVFPLFEPMNEKKWVADWNPTVIYPPNGTVEEGLVFTTEKDGEPAIWTLTHYNAGDHRVEYNKVEPGHVVINVAVRCEPGNDDTTRVTVSYTMTALSDRGQNSVAAFTDDHYEEWMAQWTRAINHYLATGTLLS